MPRGRSPAAAAAAATTTTSESMPISFSESKANIPKALREQVWIAYAGRVFERKCLVSWCQNKITAFDFHTGHNIPESRGGATDISNLRPICARCNLSMGSQYTIDTWNQLSEVYKPKVSCCCTQ
jgi:5-methylcytosine-specific restriction endonuclease McrA